METNGCIKWMKNKLKHGWQYSAVNDFGLFSVVSFISHNGRTFNTVSFSFGFEITAITLKQQSRCVRFLLTAKRKKQTGVKPSNKSQHDRERNGLSLPPEHVFQKYSSYSFCVRVAPDFAVDPGSGHHPVVFVLQPFGPFSTVDG